MRILGLLFALILLPGALRASELRPVIRREAGKCAAAWQRADYDTIMAYVPPPLIRQAGGRVAMLREIKGQFAEARRFGAESLEAVPGTPPPPRAIGRWLVSVLPLNAILHGPHLDLTQSTHLLALSADQGRHWYFVLLYHTTQAELNALFPELAGKVDVPADPDPQVDVGF